MANLDVAYAFARHITVPFVQDFQAELEHQLLVQYGGQMGEGGMFLEKNQADKG